MLFSDVNGQHRQWQSELCTWIGIFRNNDAPTRDLDLPHLKKTRVVGPLSLPRLCDWKQCFFCMILSSIGWCSDSFCCWDVETKIGKGTKQKIEDPRKKQWHVKHWMLPMCHVFMGAAACVPFLSNAKDEWMFTNSTLTTASAHASIRTWETHMCKSQVQSVQTTPTSLTNRTEHKMTSYHFLIKTVFRKLLDQRSSVSFSFCSNSILVHLSFDCHDFNFEKENEVFEPQTEQSCGWQWKDGLEFFVRCEQILRGRILFMKSCIWKKSMHASRLAMASFKLWQQQSALFHLTMTGFVIGMSSSNDIGCSDGSEGHIFMSSGVFLSDDCTSDSCLGMLDQSGTEAEFEVTSTRPVANCTVPSCIKKKTWWKQTFCSCFEFQWARWSARQELKLCKTCSKNDATWLHNVSQRHKLILQTCVVENMITLVRCHWLCFLCAWFCPC